MPKTKDKKNPEETPPSVGAPAPGRQLAPPWILAAVAAAGVAGYLSVYARSRPVSEPPATPAPVSPPIAAPAKSSEVHAQVRHAAEQSADRYTVPIVEQDHLTETFPEGTGVLLRVGADRLLVTARHVIDGVVDARKGFAVADANGRMIRVTRGVTYESQGPLNRDLVDLAALKLEDGVADMLTAGADGGSGGRAFLPLASLSIERERPTDPYLAFGYLQAAAEPGTPSSGDSSRLALFTHVIVSIGDQPYDPAVHLAFASSNGAGTGIKRAPASGCGIWRVRADDPSKWSEDDLRLVGIQHSDADTLVLAQASDDLIATRASALLGVLAQNPAYRGVIADLFPRFDAGAPAPAKGR